MRHSGRTAEEKKDPRDLRSEKAGCTGKGNWGGPRIFIVPVVSRAHVLERGVKTAVVRCAIKTLNVQYRNTPAPPALVTHRVGIHGAVGRKALPRNLQSTGGLHHAWRLWQRRNDMLMLPPSLCMIVEPFIVARNPQPSRLERQHQLHTRRSRCVLRGGAREGTTGQRPFKPSLTPTSLNVVGCRSSRPPVTGGTSPKESSTMPELGGA